MKTDPNDAIWEIKLWLDSQYIATRDMRYIEAGNLLCWFVRARGALSDIASGQYFDEDGILIQDMNASQLMEYAEEALASYPPASK